MIKQLFCLQVKNKIFKDKNGLEMLLSNTENEVDEHILKKKKKFIDKLNGMKEVYLKTMSEATDFKMKQKTYVFS